MTRILTSFNLHWPQEWIFGHWRRFEIWK